ncbi:hypothetical protein I3843_09G161000 [Carya illinoinensis]|nr:hypothetical protein I3843_09G161000 [Carya illinoinensis]
MVLYIHTTQYMMPPNTYPNSYPYALIFNYVDLFTCMHSSLSNIIGNWSIRQCHPLDQPCSTFYRVICFSIWGYHPLLRPCRTLRRVIWRSLGDVEI